jgi:hypothetical protein
MLEQLPDGAGELVSRRHPGRLRLHRDLQR